MLMNASLYAPQKYGGKSELMDGMNVQGGVGCINEFGWRVHTSATEGESMVTLPLHTPVKAKRVRYAKDGSNDEVEVTLYRAPSGLFERVPAYRMKDYFQVDEPGFKTKAETGSDLKVGDRLVVEEKLEEGTYVVHEVRDITIAMPHMPITATRDEAG
jgi:hypothetical protein